MSSAFVGSFEQPANDINVKYGVECSREPLDDSPQCLNHPLDRFQSDETTSKPFILPGRSQWNSLPKATPSAPYETAPCAYADLSNFHRLPRHGNRPGIPIHWLDKVLEQSISLRTPAEEFYEKERMPDAATTTGTLGIVTKGQGCQLRRQGAVYISSTSRKNRKVAGLVERKNLPIQYIHDWPFPSGRSIVDYSVKPEDHVVEPGVSFTCPEADFRRDSTGYSRCKEDQDTPGTSGAAAVGLASTTTAAMQASVSPMSDKDRFPSLTDKSFLDRFEFEDTKAQEDAFETEANETIATAKGCLNGAFDGNNSDDGEEEWNNYIRAMMASQEGGHREKWDTVVDEIASRRKSLQLASSRISEQSEGSADESPSKRYLDTDDSMCDGSWADSYGGHLV